MIRLIPEHEPVERSDISHSEHKSTCRLMVIVPGPEADISTITRRIWDLASATGAPIRLLGLCHESTQEPALRRALITASALLNAGKASADSEIILGRDWRQAVRSRLRPGDMVVSWNEAHLRESQRAVNFVLQADLGVPVYLLSGLHPKSETHPGWLPAAAAWLGSIAIIVAFFWLQVEIVQLSTGWDTVLQVLTIAAEIKLLLVWNGLFG